MTNLTISSLKLNTVAAAQGIKAQPQNQAKVETNNNNAGKANDKKPDLHATSEAIKAAQAAPGDANTKGMVDMKLNELLNDEQGLVRAATLGKKNQSCTMNNVTMKISQSYDEKSQKMTINIESNGYKRTEVKDMKPLQGKIKEQNESDKKNSARDSEGGLQEVRNGKFPFKTDDGRILEINLPSNRLFR